MNTPLHFEASDKRCPKCHRIIPASRDIMRDKEGNPIMDEFGHPFLYRNPRMVCEFCAIAACPPKPRRKRRVRGEVEEGQASDHASGCPLAAERAEQREEPKAEAGNFKKELCQMLTGGNHLASVLIGRLGANETGFPAYKTHPKLASGKLSGEDLDLWYAWRGIMLFRDRMIELGVIE